MMTYLLDIAQNFRAADFFDITIMFFLIYVVLMWFRKTASRFVFIGIVILGLVYVFARFFQLYLTVFVLQGFFAILIIAMVIIFQEDIRRLFERMALWHVKRKKRSSVVSHEEIDVLTRAVARLAHRRFGALIALKGNEYLDRHLVGGILLDGKLSEALLESIFDPHSVGHDGAVVVENGRIAKFGCRLPLSLNTMKIGSLGLRHTAALGLAERTDALCIVVSEERGVISVAQNESLIQLKGPEQLRSELETYYQKRFPIATGKTWLSRLRENFWEKAIAFFLTCGLWLAFGYQTETVHRDFSVPIEYRNLASDWIIKEPTPIEATVTLTGSDQAFNLSDPKMLKISLDMSRIKEGEQEIVLGREQLRYPPNLSVFRIEPSKIPITAHRMILVDVPIKVRTFGELPSPLVLRGITANPKSVKVMVLPQHNTELKILTEPIDLKDIKNTLVLTPKLVFPSDVQSANNKPPQVQVTIEVEKKSTLQQQE